ncbi:MAG: type IX secretion system sortase PorU [Bacteroidales bacterium]
MHKLFCFIFTFLPIFIFSQEILNKPYVLEYFNGTELPYYIMPSKKIPVNSKWDYYLNIDSTYFVSSNQLSKYSHNIASDFQIYYQEQIVSGEKQIIFFVCPFRKVSDTLIEVLFTWEIKTIVSPYTEDLITQKRAYTNESVLSKGKWIKLSTTHKGFHCINYENLLSWGLISSSIPSDQLRVFCNGSRMLPEANNDFRYDDLHEISIEVYDGGDGMFGPGDYAIFYVEAPIYWDFDHGNNRYVHSRNLYSEKNFVFVTISNEGVAQRINLANTPIDNEDINVTTFMDYALSEKELYNFNKSGKQWVGDKFDFTLMYNYNFSFPNIIADSNVYIRTIVYGRSEFPSSFRLTYNNYNYNIPISPIHGYLDDYAKKGEANIIYKSSTPDINITLRYQKGSNNSAVGWLDYIEVLAWRELKFYGNQMSFSHPFLPKNKIAKYQISNTPNTISVYDISTPEHPSKISGLHNANVFQFTDSTNKLKEYIAINGNYYTPNYEGIVENQNLHGLSQVDYIIIAPDKFYPMAKKIGDLHKYEEGLSYIIVSPDKIYNEFSGGKQDISAIRDFIKMFYDRAINEDEKPKYVLLFGDASYDYLNRIKNNTNLIPTFQSLASVSPTASYASDDFFALLDDGEGYDCYGALDVAVGRFPVNTENEAWAMVEKIERYYKKQGANTGITICDDAECLVPQLGDWRNRVVLIADDEDGNTYINQAENIANIIETKAPQLNIQKIYLDAYPQISTPAGQRAPEVNSAINDAMNNGMLLFNYIGHGGEEGLAHERIVQISDILSWHNACAMPLVVTATCEFSRFDDPERTSAGEYVILNPKGGAVTMMTTSRIAYSSYNAVLNNALIDTLMDFVNSDRPAFGDLFKIAKNSANNAVPLRNFVLLGDPAARITLPYNKIIIDTINNNSISAIDTLSAFEFVTIKGHIEDFQADVVNNFNGTIYVTMYDKKQTLSTLGTDISSFPTTFESFTNIVYKGSATVKNGEFKIDFFMPIDIQYDFDKGRLTLYAENGMEDASGYTHDFLIGGTAIPIADNEGPEINLFLNSINFRNGDIVDENPTILALISDEHGINLTGQAIGHDLVAWIDYDYKDPYILNPYFRYFLDSYKEGYLIFPLHDLSAGYHSLTLKAWDVFNNSSEATVTFQVIPKHNLTINTVIPYPNPMTTSTTFFIQHNQACCDNKIIIEIYDLLGKKIAKLYDESYNESYANTEIYWDGKSIHGNTVTSGTYVYKAWLENDNGTSALSSGKILILPEK